MQENSLELETLKLLISVAWADHEVSNEEAEYVLFLAQQNGVNASRLESLHCALANERRLPGVNLPLLRQHRTDVLRAVDQLIRVDERIVDDEIAVRRAIECLLEEDSVPHSGQT